MDQRHVEHVTEKVLSREDITRGNLAKEQEVAAAGSQSFSPHTSSNPRKLPGY